MRCPKGLFFLISAIRNYGAHETLRNKSWRIPEKVPEQFLKGSRKFPEEVAPIPCSFTAAMHGAFLYMVVDVVSRHIISAGVRQVAQDCRAVVMSQWLEAILGIRQTEPRTYSSLIVVRALLSNIQIVAPTDRTNYIE